MNVLRQHRQPDVVGISKFYMMRCLVTMAHADGVFHEEEEQYLLNFVERLPFSEEQKQILFNDFNKPEALENLMPFIDSHSYRAQLSFFARILAYKDGVFHPKEQDILKKINANQLSGQALKDVMEHAKETAALEIDFKELPLEDNKPKEGKHFISWFGLLDKFLTEFEMDTKVRK